MKTASIVGPTVHILSDVGIVLQWRCSSGWFRVQRSHLALFDIVSFVRNFNLIVDFNSTIMLCYKPCCQCVTMTQCFAAMFWKHCLLV